MSIFGIIVSIFVSLMVLGDFILLPKQSRNALKWMSALYFFIIIFIWIPEPFNQMSRALGVGRAVDVLIYLSILILMREFFLSRQKQHNTNKQITNLAREIALTTADKCGSEKQG